MDGAPISPPGIDEHGAHRKLSAIKEASLTKEQIIRKQTEQGIVLDRSMTIYQSFRCAAMIKAYPLWNSGDFSLSFHHSMQSFTWWISSPQSFQLMLVRSLGHDLQSLNRL